MKSIRDRVVSEFVEIVQIDSLSLKEEKMFKYLEKRLDGLNIQKYFKKYDIPDIGASSGNLIVKVKGNTTGKKAIFFDSHLDTVEPGIGIKPVVRKDRIVSSGDTVLGSDDKAGVAAMIVALEELNASKIPHGDVYFVFTSAEEIGLLGVQHLDFQKLKADYGFILDSHGDIGGVVVAAPNHYHYDIVVKGKASHAGIAPDQGVNAIRIAAEIVRQLPQGKINKDTVANVGIIEGGKATNIIAEECHIKAEFRSHNQEDILKMKAKVQAAVDSQKKAAMGIELDFKEMYRGFKYNKQDPIIHLVDKAVKGIGLKPRYERTGGGSNTNIYNQNRIAALTLAVGMMEVHTSQEYVMIEDLENAVKLILKLIELA